jgi:hypothetical protein
MRAPLLLLALIPGLVVAAAPPPASPAPASPPQAATTQTHAEDPWGPRWSGLAGTWSGEGQGQPGQGGGTFTFRFELDRKILVRRSQADYPESNGRPAVHHEDLIVIYPEGGGPGTRAIYFDNEGHVIEYKASWSGDGQTLTFVSAARADAPTFRLAYRATAADTMTVGFEMAPPGSSTFKPYVSGTVRRTGAP